jgi:hypothetical protein
MARWARRDLLGQQERKGLLDRKVYRASRELQVPQANRDWPECRDRLGQQEHKV